MWHVDPLERSVEMYKLFREHWLWLGVAAEDERVRAEPFEAIELELGFLWDLPGATSEAEATK